jgi:hypothetical protein
MLLEEQYETDDGTTLRILKFCTSATPVIDCAMYGVEARNTNYVAYISSLRLVHGVQKCQ